MPNDNPDWQLAVDIGTATVIVGSGTVDVGNAVVTQPDVNVIQTLRTVSTPVWPTTVSIFDATVSAPAAEILVTVGGADTIATDIIAVQVRNITTGIWSEYQYGWLGAQSNATDARLYFPIPCDTGDTVQVMASKLAGTAGNVGYRITGNGVPMRPYPLRVDGRQHPYGIEHVGVQPTNGGNIIAAPGANKAIMLQSVVVAEGSTNSAIWAARLNATVGGVGANLGSAAAAPANATLPPLSLFWPEGFLLDPNTALSLSYAYTVPTNLPLVSAVWDVVPFGV